jgi:anaerobic selenocysteine-containing dehydrogenase
MGLKDAVFRMPESELLHELFRGAGGAISDIDPATIITAGPVKLAPGDAQTFATPSGKLEIYSEGLHSMGVSPLPDWRPDPEEERDAAKWPLRLLTAPGYFQAHTAFESVEFLKQRQGPVACIMHPDDAERRGLVEGDAVRLRNDRAQVRMRLQVSDEVQRGVVLVPGQRTDTDDESGTVNMLCSDRYTDIGEGATYQSTFLDVTRWDAVPA